MVGITETAKDTEVSIFWWSTEKKLVRGGVAGGTTRTSVDEVCGGGEGFCPERRRHRRVKKHGADAVVQGA